MRRLVLLAAALAASLLVAACGELTDVQAQDSGITSSPLDPSVEVVIDGFTRPSALAALGEDEFLVVEQARGLYHVQNGERTAVAATPTVSLYDIGGLLLGGMQDVSLHPDFDANGLVYIVYLSEAETMSVARFGFGDRVVEDFEVIFESNARSATAALAWQDADHLFVAQGTTDARLPQNFSFDSGKIHRLLADGSVPVDNPVFDGTDGPSTVWSIGHGLNRGLVYADGVLYANEHTPGFGGDEFNIIDGGGNYGYPNVSPNGGNPNAPAVDDDVLATMIDPAASWGDFIFNPSGMILATGSAFPALDGLFVFGALDTEQLVAHDVETGETTVRWDDAGRLLDLAVLPSGDLLVAVGAPTGEPGQGELLRLSPPGQPEGG